MFLYTQGFSDESDDIDFQPPTPKRKVCKTRSSRSPSQSQSTLTLRESEIEEAKAAKHTRFEEMATKFGFSSSLEFAEHVTSISKEERKALLEEFKRVTQSSKEKGKGKAKEKGISIDPEMSSSSGAGSNKRKRMVPRTGSRTAKSASKRAPAKRKPKRLEYLDQDSPQVSPRSRAEKECLTTKESSFTSPAADTGVAEDHRQKEESSKEHSLSADSTCLDNGIDNELLDNQRVHRKLVGQAHKSSRSLDKDQSQSLCLNIDGNSLVDRLFEDDQPVPSLPRSVAASSSTRSTVTAAASKSAAPVLSSETCSPSVNIVGKVKLQSDSKSAQNTDLNIDELLFGF